MSPQEIVAAEQARVEALYVIQKIAPCETHGIVHHGRERGSWLCIPCAVERLASMSDAARDVRGLYEAKNAINERE